MENPNFHLKSCLIALIQLIFLGKITEIKLAAENVRQDITKICIFP